MHDLFVLFFADAARPDTPGQLGYIGGMNAVATVAVNVFVILFVFETL